MQVKKIVQTQKEMRKYLVKVHRCYITDRLHHRSKQRVIALSNYPSTIHVYLRDVHISPPYLDNNISVALKPARKQLKLFLLVEKCIRKHIHPDIHMVHSPLDGSYETEIPCRAFRHAKERQKMSSTCAGWWVHQLFPSREPSLVLLNLRLAFSFTALISISRERTLK